ncbi:MAG: hypothetical protein FWF15_12345, partial [Oscillospiraceae bacterium]|nr:hypothetical protein [Oscillospiraceae bacterium]
KDADNIPYYDILTERSVSTFEKALKLINNDYTYSFVKGWEDKKIIPMFANGNGLLLMTQIGIIQQLRNMEIDFGLLPVPKLNEQQEKYLLNIDGHAQLMAIPITVRETEKVGAILEALSYYSHKYLVPAYYDVNLKTKFSRDNESSEMLDIIMDGRIFDFGYVYDNWVIAFQFQYLIREKAINYVSKIESLLPTAEAQLKKILDAYDAIE